MKKIIMLMLVVICISSVFISESRAQKKQQWNKWSGFRGIRWGTNIKDINDPNFILLFDDKKTNNKYFIKRDNKNKIGKADLEYICYVFYKNIFYGIMIITEGEENFNYLKSAIFAYYGKGKEVLSYYDEWQWYNESYTVGLNLKVSPLTDEGEFGMAYIPVLQQIMRDDAKAAEDAKDDF